MLFERIESEGLSHYSYLVGSGAEAVVIDPRRDIDIYLDMAERSGYHIRHILETHRNEDYLVGSIELAGRTGAEIWHADSQLSYQYGKGVEDGQEWRLGGDTLCAISTPGHTSGSMSYVLSDAHGTALMVFTGDTLFAGEVGRTDLPGEDRTLEMAGMLYDSIFEKLLPLGDGVIVCPAHGAGSVCGSSISDRAWTTIGTERLSNPRLKLVGRDDFVQATGVNLEKLPYFKKMEELNLSGSLPLGSLPEPKALSPDMFAELAKDFLVLDTRFDGFAAAHVPGSVCISLNGVSSFGGWFLTADERILLVCDSYHLRTIITQLRRMGYDRIEGYLVGGILAWLKDGRDSESIKTVTVPELCGLLDTGEDAWVLDVRSQAELDQVGEIPGAHHLHVTQIDERRGEVPRDRPIYVVCGSGVRSMMGASLLQRAGWQNLTVVLGGFSTWKSVSCPLRQAGTS